jgi:transcriptional regulator with XRE-family HTH domain
MSDVLTESDVREELRLLADSMSTHKALADKIGISPQYLHDILRGNRKPGRKVLAFLKLKAVTVYRERR